MREVNLDRLRELAGHMRDAVRELEVIGQTPKETFLANPSLTEVLVARSKGAAQDLHLTFFTTHCFIDRDKPGRYQSGLRQDAEFVLDIHKFNR